MLQYQNEIISKMKDRIQKRKEKSNTDLKAQLPLDNNEFVNLKASMPLNVTLVPFQLRSKTKCKFGYNAEEVPFFIKCNFSYNTNLRLYWVTLGCMLL